MFAALFPVGLAMLAFRRFMSSSAMIGCIVLTGLFVVIILQAVLRQSP
jgi:hypothetical protein